jgi:hypothetical protein
VAPVTRFAQWWACGRRVASDVWPDGYVSVLAMLGALSVLANEASAERASITRLLPDWAATTYLAMACAAAFCIAAGVATRRPVVASRAAAVLAVLIAFNAAAVWLAYHGDATFSMCLYCIAAILVTNRSYVLSRGVVVPGWLASKVRR